MTARTDSQSLARRPFGIVVTTAIVALALTTGWIHLGLGGLLFTLNGLGYLGLAALYVLAAVAPHPFIAAHSWLPRLALAGYAALTIVAWAVQGPYFPLAYTAKVVEAGLIALIVVDAYRVYGGPLSLVRAALASLPGRRPTSTPAA